MSSICCSLHRSPDGISSSQITTISILRNSSSNDTDKVNALSLYIASISNQTTPLNASTTLTLGEIDNIVGGLQTSGLTVNTSTSIIFSLSPKSSSDDNSTVLGGSYQQNIGGQIVDTENEMSVISTNISVAGVFTPSSVLPATSIRVVIISDSSAYANIDNFTNRTLASSILSAKLQRNNVSISGPLEIKLYFQVLAKANATPNADFLCVFYDDNTTRWSDSGCTVPTYNRVFARYECKCNHLSSFALVWLPKSSQSTNVNTSTPVVWDADDIASLVFQSLSIACFLGVVIHGTVMRVTQPSNFTAPRNLFPLLSCAVTMVLFVFYIALSMTVFNRFYFAPANSPSQGRTLESKANPVSTTQAPSSEVMCLPHESSLAFTTYFFLILMFCIKTGSGYLNYEHFVRLFPPPSKRRLLLMFAISFLVSIFLVALAAGLNSNPSNKITRVAARKVCWFSTEVIHYFLTIPISIFLALNIIVIVLVARRMIIYAKAPQDSSKRSQYIRRKRCVILILSSCVTQGVGWLFGPLISIASPTAGTVLMWFFIIFNGLEGLWAVILYIFIRKEGLDEDKRAPSSTVSPVTKFDREYDSPSLRRSDRRTDLRKRPEFNEMNHSGGNESHTPFTDLATLNVIYRNDSYQHEDDEDRHDQ